MSHPVRHQRCTEFMDAFAVGIRNGSQNQQKHMGAVVGGAPNQNNYTPAASTSRNRQDGHPVFNRETDGKPCHPWNRATSVVSRHLGNSSTGRCTIWLVCQQVSPDQQPQGTRLQQQATVLGEEERWRDDHNNPTLNAGFSITSSASTSQQHDAEPGDTSDRDKTTVCDIYHHDCGIYDDDCIYHSRKMLS